MAKSKRTYPKKSPEQVQEEINRLTEGMEERISNHFHSPDQLKEYLDFMGKFYRYSPKNTALIDSQFSGAEAVGSFAFWKEKGFPVNKGEQGIKILVPNRLGQQFKNNEGEWKSLQHATKQEKEQVKDGQLDKREGRLVFSIGSVFDVSQTSASQKDLPHIFPNKWIDGKVENYKPLRRGMEAIADKNNIQIVEPYEELGAAKGVSYTGRGEVALNPRNSERQDTKSLLHELTHAKLHTEEKRDHYTKPEKEFQAEMTAYTVASYFNIDTSDYSLDYLHQWTKDHEFKDYEGLLQEVQTTAKEFISTIEDSWEKEQEGDKDMKMTTPSNEKRERNMGQQIQVQENNQEKEKGVFDPLPNPKPYQEMIILVNKESQNVKTVSMESLIDVATLQVEQKEIKPLGDISYPQVKQDELVKKFNQANEKGKGAFVALSPEHQKNPETLPSSMRKAIEGISITSEVFKEADANNVTPEHPSLQRSQPSIEKEPKQEEEKLPSEKLRDMYRRQVSTTERNESPFEPKSEKEKGENELDKQAYKDAYKKELMNFIEPKVGKGLDQEESNDRQERLNQMRVFEKTHSMESVYKLKKESLQELKELPLSEYGQQRLVQVEMTLDQEFSDQKGKNGEKRKGKSVEEKADESKQGSSQPKHKKQRQKVEMER
ncbi:ImmA/IrrE family metallo-endopeptidase [Halobacillus shinanisalinarum]|uniref:ImmA/IrrE family metallo-endopeptidase n=1 Tax=Halobacillus shinanisalinarum TaxID=2932258 RepID=A0ABY4H1H9_9BACI|nr:ImmA/IrrE family metallo-endopeptidase [Halobacillus shinanisalinarum]UOQ94041.1 ImmA/IrrE family metallo-endopeptidase [Halobacillus shinanisalinarum]